MARTREPEGDLAGEFPFRLNRAESRKSVSQLSPTHRKQSGIIDFLHFRFYFPDFTFFYHSALFSAGGSELRKPIFAIAFIALRLGRFTSYHLPPGAIGWDFFKMSGAQSEGKFACEIALRFSRPRHYSKVLGLYCFRDGRPRVFRNGSGASQGFHETV